MILLIYRQSVDFRRARNIFSVTCTVSMRLRSSSGIIREKIRETFGHIISEEDEVRLANLIYYPEKMINQIKQANEYTEDWQKTAVYRLVQICREVSSKYTRSKVRKKMPKEFSGVIDELLYVDNTDDTKSITANSSIP